MPILGPTDIPRIFVATGHFRNGILLAPITAQIMADLIQVAPLLWTSAPSRRTAFVAHGSKAAPANCVLTAPVLCKNSFVDLEYLLIQLLLKLGVATAVASALGRSHEFKKLLFARRGPANATSSLFSLPAFLLRLVCISAFA